MFVNTSLHPSLSYCCSDPYTRLSLYDPVNGEITSLQTKTIKKVNTRHFRSTAFICALIDVNIFIFLISCYLKTLDPKWNEEFFFKVSETYLEQYMCLQYLLCFPGCSKILVNTLHFRKLHSLTVFVKHG